MSYNRRQDLLERRGIIKKPRLVRCSFCLEKLAETEQYPYQTWVLCQSCHREAISNGKGNPNHLKLGRS